MKVTKRIATLFLVLVMMFGCSITAFASLGVDSNGKEILYVVDVSEVGSFDGNGQTIDIYNCTNAELYIYINGAKKYTLAANGDAGSVLAFTTQQYTYVFSYEQGSAQLNIYVGQKGDNELGNTSTSAATEALAAKAKAEEKGDEKQVEALDAVAQENMTTYMQGLSEFEANRLKSEDAFISAKSSCKKSNTLSNEDIVKKYDECHEELVNSVSK